MRWNGLQWVVAVQLGALVSNYGQTDLHRIAGIKALPDRMICLELAGSAPEQFRSYFDLYVLEVSNNAADWSSFTTLLRTNSSQKPG